MNQQTRIVMIDDDQDACELLKMELEDSGKMRVTYNTKGEEALALISRERPDIVILDINMPGINGVDVGALLAAEATTADIPILYLSGMVTPDEAREMAKGESRPQVISKGSPVDELITAIDTLTTN